MLSIWHLKFSENVIVNNSYNIKFLNATSIELITNSLIKLSLALNQVSEITEFKNLTQNIFFFVIKYCQECFCNEHYLCISCQMSLIKNKYCDTFYLIANKSERIAWYGN